MWADGQWMNEFQMRRARRQDALIPLAPLRTPYTPALCLIRLLVVGRNPTELSGNASKRFEKSSCPSSSAFISTFPPVYLSAADKSRFGPRKIVRLHIVLGACKVSRSTQMPPLPQGVVSENATTKSISWASWDMGLGVKTHTRKKGLSPNRCPFASAEFAGAGGRRKRGLCHICRTCTLKQK